VNKKIRLDIIKGQNEFNMLQGKLSKLLLNKKKKRLAKRRDDQGQLKKM